MNETEMRKLDAWIAEHVMGWLFNRYGLAFSPVAGDDTKWTQERVVPYYTTDPAAAMQVLEKCIDATTHTICVGRLNLPPEKKRRVVFLGGTYEKTKQEAEKLPLAICLFAKKLFSEKSLATARPKP